MHRQAAGKLHAADSLSGSAAATPCGIHGPKNNVDGDSKSILPSKLAAIYYIYTYSP